MARASQTDPTSAQASLLLDAETKQDLNLFGSEEGSLFAYCDTCRTEAGRKALRKRMDSPSSNADRIRSTQSALRYIISHRSSFEGLPSEYVALNTERYVTSAFPVIRQKPGIEFQSAAFFFWMSEDEFFSKIVLGVEVTRRFVLGMRALTATVLAEQPTGELAELMQEVTTLLQSDGLARVEDKPPRYYWHKLTLDQIFRFSDKSNLVRLMQLAAELDALVSLADVVQSKQLVMPEILDGEVRIEAEALVHPLMDDPVPNAVDIGQANRVLFLTGPNMAGKTTYLRALATGLYFAHLGLGVPAQRFAFVPVERLLAAISPTDDLGKGISYFRAEALRMKAIAKSVGGGFRTIAVVDEPFKGTNVKDAFDATLAVLERLADADGCLFVVTSHLVELSEPLSHTNAIGFGYFEAMEESSRLSFDYTLRSGVSDQRLGMRVLQEEGVFDLLDAPREAAQIEIE